MIRSRIAQVLGGTALGILIASLSEFEGYRHRAYVDQAGVPTICYGHTRGVRIGQQATRTQCDAWLEQDARAALDSVERYVIVQLSEPKRAMLGSFVYNLGPRRFMYSTLLARINAGDPHACDEFKRWVYHYAPSVGRHVKNQGLVNRRTEEVEICVYEPGHEF